MEIEKIAIPKLIDVHEYVDGDVHFASFDYYQGMKIVKELNLVQTGEMSEVRTQGKFVVCCGDVMIRVTPENYPDFERNWNFDKTGRVLDFEKDDCELIEKALSQILPYWEDDKENHEHARYLIDKIKNFKKRSEK